MYDTTSGLPLRIHAVHSLNQLFCGEEDGMQRVNGRPANYAWTLSATQPAGSRQLFSDLFFLSVQGHHLYS